jgi:hypothetical protein
MAVKIHIYSAASFFSFLMLLPQVLGLFGNPKIVAAQVDLPQLFYSERERFSELRGFQGGLMVEKELPLHKLGHKHQG